MDKLDEFRLRPIDQLTYKVLADRIVGAGCSVLLVFGRDSSGAGDDLRSVDLAIVPAYRIAATLKQRFDKAPKSRRPYWLNGLKLYYVSIDRRQYAVVVRGPHPSEDAPSIWDLLLQTFPDGKRAWLPSSVEINWKS